MNEAIRVENKKEDKKFLGKFLLILAGAFLVGILEGFGMAFLEDATELPAHISAAVQNFIVTVAPYVSALYAVVMGIVLILTHRKVSAMAKAWDGEDEEAYNKMDGILGNVLSALSIGMVITYFFFAVGFEDIVDRSVFADCCYFGKHNHQYAAQAGLLLLPRPSLRCQSPDNGPSTTDRFGPLHKVGPQTA